MNFDGVILAAGLGSRLKDLSREKGKFFPQVAGKHMINYAIDFMRELGAARVFVVGGYMFSKLSDLLRGANVELVENKNFEGKGNLLSLATAFPYINGSLVHANVDHIYNRALAPHIRSQLKGITAFCDFDRQLEADDMKVLLNSEFRIQSSESILKSEIRNLKLFKISKQLTEFHCGYVGMTYVDKTELSKYKLAAQEALKEFGETAYFEQIMAHLAKKGEPINIGDISGYGWLEIDTPEELYRAEKTILASPEKFLITHKHSEFK